MIKRIVFIIILAVLLLYGCVTLAEDSKVTVEYTFSSETAQIGQPFTVYYEIKGGSGQYENIHYNMCEITEYTDITENDYYSELDQSEGSFTIVPESGEYITVNVSCTDEVTGIYWCENYSEHIRCTPNQNIPVVITVSTETIALGEELAFSYSIGGSNEIENARVKIWAFVRNDTYPDCVYTQSINSKEGVISFIPRVGNQLFITIRGKDSDGQPFYAKTERMAVDTRNGYDPVTVEYTYSSETAQIGQPFTVHYEIKGGSGEYDEIYYNMDGVTEYTCIDCQSYELDQSEGSFTIVPECGECIDINICCRDKVTCICWCENYSDYIKCTPNQRIPAAITVSSDTIILNEEFSFTYSIGGSNEIDNARVEIWAFARNDIYPDCVYEQYIEDKEGIVVYTPVVGNQLYIAVRGKDSDGQPFYVKTKRINVKDIIFVDCLILPESLSRIKAYAFSQVKATKVYIPDSVTYIDKDAFTDSSISTILGNSEYVEQFANDNGFDYINYSTEDD